jgi:hypothetical protein
MQIQLIDSPTGRTTAATDALLALLAWSSLFYLNYFRQNDPWKVSLWSWAFGLLALGAALGAVAHGFKMSTKTNRRLWQPLNLALGLVVALFTAGVIYDLWGVSAARQALPWLIGAGLLFFGATQRLAGGFLLFILYQGTAMLFALGAYGWLAATGQLAGAWLMAVGVSLTLTAAAMQAGRTVSFTFIWQFDHNGVYHLIQMMALPALVVGLRAALSA